MKTFHRLKKEVGLAVLKKYNYKCTMCGSDKNLCVHHIERINPDNEKYNEIDNLTVLCRQCHMSYHRKAGHIVQKSKPKPPKNPWGRRGKDNPPVVCMIDGCNRLQHGRKLCKKHYEYYRRRNWAGLD